MSVGLVGVSRVQDPTRGCPGTGGGGHALIGLYILLMHVPILGVDRLLHGAWGRWGGGTHAA